MISLAEKRPGRTPGGHVGHQNWRCRVGWNEALPSAHICDGAFPRRVRHLGRCLGTGYKGGKKTLKISAMFYSQSAPFCNEGSWLLPLSQHFLLSKRKKYNREVFSICSKTNVDRKRNKGESGQVLSYSHCRILAFPPFENGFTILFRRGMMNH